MSCDGFRRVCRSAQSEPVVLAEVVPFWIGRPVSRSEHGISRDAHKLLSGVRWPRNGRFSLYDVHEDSRIKPGNGRLGLRDAVNWTFLGATNYYLALVIDLTVALVFFGVGIRQFVGHSSVAIAVVLLGFLTFGFLEYAVHRWLLHGPSSFARRGHRHHHAEPMLLVATPFFVIAIASVAIWQLLRLVCPAGVAAFFVFGLYAGYNHFALFHHWIHHRRSDLGRGSYWWRLDQLHHLHHRRQGSNFGVSTTIWDGIFGTARSFSDKNGSPGGHDSVAPHRDPPVGRFQPVPDTGRVDERRSPV